MQSLFEYLIDRSEAPQQQSVQLGIGYWLRLSSSDQDLSERGVKAKIEHERREHHTEGAPKTNNHHLDTQVPVVGCGTDN